MALTKKERDRLPSTLARSPKKAQETYIHTLEAAEKDHGDGEAAHRIALASLKHSFEKVGDHWEAKATKGSSDRQDAKVGRARRKPDTDGRWCRRVRHQDAPDGRGQATRCQGPLEDDEATTGQGHRQGQPLHHCQVTACRAGLTSVGLDLGASASVGA